VSILAETTLFLIKQSAMIQIISPQLFLFKGDF